MARIMIIEDDEEMRFSLKHFIEQEGCEADSAPNGPEAFEELAKGPFDLVITGIRKPGLAGLDILPAIKRLQPGSSIILIRGFGNEGFHRPSSESGATDNLGKPAYFDQLKNLIQEIEEALPQRKIDKGVRVAKPRRYSLPRLSSLASTSQRKSGERRESNSKFLFSPEKGLKVGENIKTAFGSGWW